MWTDSPCGLAGHQCSEPMLEELQHTLKGSMSVFPCWNWDIGGDWGWWWCCVMVVVLNLDAMVGISLDSCAWKIPAHAWCFESIKLSINGGLMFFYWSLPFEIKFPFKSELFRVFSEVLMVVFVDTWRRPPVETPCTCRKLETLQLEDGCHKRKNSV